MFLHLNHQKLDIYPASMLLVTECYKLTNQLPDSERFGMITQIRRAALSVHLNLSEGASRKSLAERKRFYEISRSSLVEVDAALDIAKALKYLEKISTDKLGKSIVNCFKMISGLIE